MPDISKINALAIGSVGKVDGLAKASILDIDGVAVPSAFTGLLDTYTGAVAGYSVRRLNSLYTGACMRIRRISDSVEADVGFDSNNVLGLTSPISNTSDAQSYTDFADFVDHTGTPTDAFCRFWYDQSGNANDAYQITTGLQPQIYDASTGLIQENSKPALFVDGNATSGNALYAQGFGTGNTRYFSYVARMTQDAGAGSSNYHNVVMFAQGLGTGGNFVQCYSTNASNSLNVYYPTAALNMSTTTATNVQHQLSVQKTSTDTEFWIDSVTQDTATGTQNLEDLLLIGKFDMFGYAVMRMQEIVIWNTDQDGAGNRSGIESNIDTYFSIP